MREMKDSGVEWIGEIPTDWSMIRVKHAFIRKNEKAMQEEPIVLSLARSGVRVRDISNNEGQVAESYFNYNPVAEGDLLLNPMDLYSGANCSIPHIEGVISPAYINLKSKEGINPVFYDYYFKAQYWLMAFFSYGKGVSFDNRWTLSVETLMNYPLVIPSYEEQCKRAEYLVVECGKMDIFIAKQQDMINKLKAFKQSAITEKVTKGLNPDVEMKNSGIEFIGDIPNHWKLVRLKFLLTYLIDCPHETPTYDADGKYLVIRTADQDLAVLRKDEDMLRLSESEYQNRIRRMSLDKDDIIYGREGGRWGLACLVPESNKYCLGQRMLQFRCDKKMFDPQFAVYALSSSTIYLQGSFDTMGSASPHVNISTVQNYAIAVPPLREQEYIAKKLQDTCKKIELEIKKRQRFIDKITQYKKALIYEVVTGKKEIL